MSGSFKSILLLADDGQLAQIIKTVEGLPLRGQISDPDLFLALPPDLHETILVVSAHMLLHLDSVDRLDRLPVNGPGGRVYVVDRSDVPARGPGYVEHVKTLAGLLGVEQVFQIPRDYPELLKCLRDHFHGAGNPAESPPAETRWKGEASMPDQAGDPLAQLRHISREPAVPLRDPRPLPGDTWQKHGPGNVHPRARQKGLRDPGEMPAGNQVAVQQLIPVFSPKGGVGKTFVITNLAVTLAMRSPMRVALLDLDLYSNDVGVHLDQLSGPTILDVIPNAHQLASGRLDQFMVKHSSGLDILLGPPRPELSELIKVEHLTRILEQARREYAFVLLDTPPDAASDLVYESLEQATRIIAVTTMDASSLRQTKLAMDILSRLGISLKERLLVAVNRVYEGGPVSVARIASFLDFPVQAVIPRDLAAVEASIFDGRPLVQTRPDHPVSQALYSLADLIHPGLSPESRRNATDGRLSWLKGWKMLGRLGAKSGISPRRR